MIILRSRRNQNHIITSSHHHIITCQISKSPLSAASVARSGAGAGAGGSAALDAAKEEEEEEEEKEEEEDAAEESGSWAWPAEGSWDRAARSFIAATSLGVCGSSALSSDDDVEDTRFAPGDPVDDFLSVCDSLASRRRGVTEDRMRMEEAYVRCNEEARLLIADWHTTTVPGSRYVIAPAPQDPADPTHADTQWASGHPGQRPSWAEFKDAFSALFVDAGSEDRWDTKLTSSACRHYFNARTGKMLPTQLPYSQPRVSSRMAGSTPPSLKSPTDSAQATVPSGCHRKTTGFGTRCIPRPSTGMC